MRNSYIIKSILAISLFIYGLGLYAQNDYQLKKQKLEDEIKAINDELNITESKSRDAAKSLSLTQRKIEIWGKLIKESDLEIDNYTKKIKQKEVEINNLNNQFDTLQNNFSKVIKTIYENRETKVWYLYIISSENIGQLFRRISYLTTISQELSNQAKILKEKKAKIQDEKSKLKELNNRALTLKKQRTEQIEQLNKDKESSKQLLSQLQKEKAKYKDEIRLKKKELNRINKEIEKIRKSLTSKKSNTTTKGKDKTVIDTQLDREFAQNKGKLPWPVDGDICEHYGKRFHPIFKNVELPFNNGITINTNPNAEVKSIFNGVVKQIVIIPGYNKCVLVQHGNYYSFYCKLKEVNVKAGDKIKTGQIIGIVDTIDKTSQLHFQIWKGSQPNDPEQWLKK